MEIWVRDREINLVDLVEMGRIIPTATEDEDVIGTTRSDFMVATKDLIERIVTVEGPILGKGQCDDAMSDIGMMMSLADKNKPEKDLQAQLPEVAEIGSSHWIIMSFWVGIDGAMVV
jgi:hypothetical protein